MAKEAKAKEEAEVVLEEDGVVTIDVSDDPELAAAAGEKEEAEEKPVVERKRLETPPEEEEEEASDAVKEAEEKAAEAEKRRQAAETRANTEAARRQEAEDRATAATAEAEDARAASEKSQLSLLESGIESAKGEVEAYETQLATAYESGDFKAVASLQTKLSTAAAKVDRLTASKETFEATAGQRKAAPTTEGRVTTPPNNQVEQYLAQMAPAAQEWLRAHPECMPAQLGGDEGANSKMMAGHYAAKSQNITPNTPDYFRVIEEHTGHRKPMSAAADTKKAPEKDEGEEKPAAKPRKPTVAAPPSREPPSAKGLQNGKVSVTLSKDEQDMAKLSFPNLTPAQAFAAYARNKLELQAEGKLGRTTH